MSCPDIKSQEPPSGGFLLQITRLTAVSFLICYEDMNMALTDKQEMFCREYLIDLNATQAAIRAGYSERTANRTASENLS
ncbi:TPA: terminase small subunit, partial [Proteus mirabilis]